MKTNSTFKQLIKTIAIIFLPATSFSQSIGINNPTPNASALLDLTSTNKGLLVPRVALTSTFSAVPVTSPATGLLVYNTAIAGTAPTNVTPGFYYWSGSVWLNMLNDTKGWSTTGNSGTSFTTNFIGTTDFAPIHFKVNNQDAGAIGLNQNIFLGISAGKNSYSGGGYKAVMIGDSSGYSLNGGAWNIGIGHAALKNVTTENGLLGIGYEALARNAGGFFNTAIGVFSQANNTTGNTNVSVGTSTLRYNITGAGNCAFGSNAMQNNVTGSYNTVMGSTTMLNGISGSENVAIGHYALTNDTSGNKNTGLGTGALEFLYNGDQNTGVGYNAGTSANSSTSCTFVGYDANTTVSSGLVNSMALGNGSRVTASNQITLGNTSILSLRCNQTSITSLSDGRFKTDIKEDVQGLDFIRLLRPVTYHFDMHKLNRFLHADSTASEESVVARERVLETGFIAQEVERAADSLHFDFNGVEKPQNANDTYGIRYSSFVVPLVKAVKELDSENQKLKEENASMKARLEQVEKTLAKLVNNN
jgi:hypothetical protein